MTSVKILRYIKSQNIYKNVYNRYDFTNKLAQITLNLLLYMYVLILFFLKILNSFLESSY